MSKKSPLQVEDILLCPLYEEEIGTFTSDPAQIRFDLRQDFVIDGGFAGIGIRIDLCNARYLADSRHGVRRILSVTIVDISERREVYSVARRISIPRDNPFETLYFHSPYKDAGFRSGHTYKVVVRDDNAGSILDEEIFHIYGEKEFGHPSSWYTVEGAGIVPDAEPRKIYRSVEVSDFTDLSVRFELSHNFGMTPPMILPQLELRLHFPDGDRVRSEMIEPACVAFSENRYVAEMQFYTSPLNKGVYYAELLCMEYPVAGFVFRTDSCQKEGDVDAADLSPLDEYSQDAAARRFSMIDSKTTEEDFDALLDRFIASETEACPFPETSDTGNDQDSSNSSDISNTSNSSNPSSPLLPSLQHLTGLRAVKEKLRIYERVVLFNKMRSEKGLPVSTLPLHAMFMGSPGTGKTTVARMIGVMLRRAGVLSKGHVVVRERATLLGQNYNSEAEKTLKAIEEAAGGILLIDEAYQLYQPDDPRDPGKFVIETLLTALADESERDWMLILAGYPEQMRRMFEMNPGLRSRIPESNIYLFEDFTEEELMEIAENYLGRMRYSLSAAARSALERRLSGDYINRRSDFGNARHVINLIQSEILPSMAVRVTSSPTADEYALTEIEESDIPAPPMPEKGSPRTYIGFRA